jgi:hypothetical protein
MGSQPKSHKVFRKFPFASDFVDFSADHFGKKTFQISLRNDDVVVKICIAKNRSYQSFL